jgi:hypothetical protein
MSKPNVSDIGIKRADYKAIKKMDRLQLSDYLSRIWQRGYEAGQKSVSASLNSNKTSGGAENEIKR